MVEKIKFELEFDKHTAEMFIESFLALGELLPNLKYSGSLTPKEAGYLENAAIRFKTQYDNQMWLSKSKEPKDSKQSKVHTDTTNIDVW